MSESEELETLVYCLGQIGGEHNPVITEGSAFASKYDYTLKGYARYIKEANNVIKFMQHVINYFLESVKSEFEEDPLAFIDSESEEDMLASIHKMKKQWKDMFKEHQKKLRESLQNQTLEESSSSSKQADEESSSSPKQADEESSSSSKQADEESSSSPKQADEESLEESSSSSAKIPKLDPEAVSEATTKAAESELETASETETTSEVTDLDPEVASKSNSVGVPVENLEFPESIFLRKLKEFGRVIKAEYLELRAKMGKVLDRITPDHTAHDLKGFTLQKMEKFAKSKYTLKTLNHLVPELKSKLGDLDLDFNKRKKNEKRLTDWMYFDDGKRDRKYHHRILITMELTVSVEEISAIIWRQIRRYRKIRQSLESTLPEEYGAFKEKEEQWKYEVLFQTPMKKPVKIQTSTQSDDTYYNVDDMPLDP